MRWTRGWPHPGSAAPAPPPPGRRDLLTAAGLALFAVADIPEDTVAWEPATSLSILIAVVATYWRRSFAVGALLIAFAARFIAEMASGLADTQMQATFGQIFLLGVFIYALCRWAKWRDVWLGIGAATLLGVAGELVTTVPDWVQLFDDALIWGMLAASGLAVRYRDALGHTRAEQIRSEERERIARDLHDVVAHHVSAIAIQAEGAKAAAQTSPAVAIEALETIHNTASNTLTEMRRMVAILRDDSEVGPAAPYSSIDELRELLTDSEAPGPAVQLDIGEGLDTLPSAITAAVLRISQEAVTNARRHSRNATAIDVTIGRQNGSVEVLVVDDGERVVASGRRGFGIIGMTERCDLLGGTLSAGAGQIRGWQVRATIPVEGKHH
ncbi:MAG: histidine kinase [Acidimicrobiales bacterium]